MCSAFSSSHNNEFLAPTCCMKVSFVVGHEEVNSAFSVYRACYISTDNIVAYLLKTKL
jgi:hypothetical protein